MHIMPIIQAPDYNAFRRILNDQLPDTYAEWLQDHTEAMKEFINRSEPYRGIEVNPQEFVRFCLSRNAVATIQLLADFAVEKTSGKTY
jgi:hypothetical protein